MQKHFEVKMNNLRQEKDNLNWNISQYNLRNDKYPSATLLYPFCFISHSSFRETS